MIRLREQGASFREIGKAVGESPGTVRTRLQGGLLKLVRTLVLDELERRAHVYTATDSFHLMLHPRLGRCCKRHLVSLRIPERVALRVHAKLSE
jgi:hypothetical protein